MAKTVLLKAEFKDGSIGYIPTDWDAESTTAYLSSDTPNAGYGPLAGMMREPDKQLGMDDILILDR